VEGQLPSRRKGRNGIRNTARGTPQTFILDPQFRTGPDGSPCVFIGQVEGVPGSQQEADNELKALRLLSQYPRCAGSARPPARPSPATAAALAFKQIVNLPKPTFAIPPGSSVAGLKAYMILSGPTTLNPAPINALGYLVKLHIKSVYDIDWGDHTPSSLQKNVSSQGGKGYPKGDVFHVYESKGTYTVTVTQRWTATYEIANAASGTITDVLSTSASTQLPVQAYQAVVTQER
jgi:hypothetical protein